VSVRTGACPVSVSEEEGVAVGEVGRGGAVVLVDFDVGDVSSSEVVGEDGACPHAGGVESRGVGKDLVEKSGRGDKAMFVGDVGVVGAFPVTVPWCFGVGIAAWADLGGGIVGVEPRVRPRGTVYHPFERTELGPEVEGA
jgi:hypothetical protein